MSAAREALLSSEPLEEDIEALQVSERSSSRSVRALIGVSGAAFFGVVVLLACTLQPAGYLRMSKGHTADLQLSVLGYLPLHYRLILGIVVLVLVVALGHIILGRILKFFITQGTKRVLLGTNVAIGSLRFGPCGGRLYMSSASVSQPKGFVTSQSAQMMEVSQLVFDLSMCSLWCSLIKNKLRGTPLVIPIEQFTLRDMIVRYEQKLNFESNLKTLVDQIQEVQKKYAPQPKAENRQKSGQEKAKEAIRQAKGAIKMMTEDQIILHRVHVTGLQLQMRLAGFNAPPVKLPNIEYVDFVEETNATSPAQVALKLAGRILTLAVEAAEKELKSKATSVTKAISAEAEKFIKPLKEEAEKVSEAFAKTKVGSQLTEAGREMKEKAVALEKDIKEKAAKMGEAAQKTAKISEEASKQLAAGAKGFMDQVVHGVEALKEGGHSAGSSSSGVGKDRRLAPSSENSAFPTPVRPGIGPGSSTAARFSPEMRTPLTPLISSAAPKTTGRPPTAADFAASASSSSGVQGPRDALPRDPAAALAGVAPRPGGRPLDDDCNETGASFAEAAASIKNDLLQKVDSATTLVKGVTDRFNFCKGPSRTGPNEEIRFD